MDWMLSKESDALVQALTEASVRAVKASHGEILAALMQAREAGAREALREVAIAAGIATRSSASSSDLRHLLLDAIVGSNLLDIHKAPNLAMAISAAARALGVPLHSLSPPSRKKPLVYVRWAVWQALRDIGYSYPAIGRLDVLGQANHTTVFHAIRRMEDISVATEDGRMMLAAIRAAREQLVHKEHDRGQP